MTHHYSPHTGEHIATSTPAAWMGATELPVPTYNPATQSAFFRGGAWVVEDAAPPAALVPESITMRQCRLYLLATGKLGLVAPAIASMPSPQREAAEIEWEYGAVVWRNSPLIAQLAPVLGWATPADIDAQFQQAVAL